MSQTQFRDWLGKTSTRNGLIDTHHAQLLAATLDRDPQSIAAGSELPPLWHWCFLLETPRQSTLGNDGHPERGDFLPPVDLPRRMWAGSEVEFHNPILIGELASKTSRISEINHKHGKSGALVFVTVEHEITQNGRRCVSERQSIVFREATKTNQQPNNSPPESAEPREFDFSTPFTADPTLLFRYSAATFNAHRIHYDREYSIREENYPGLLVHGPLLATLLTEQLQGHIEADVKLSNFNFRAQTPVYDLTPFLLRGKKLNENEYQLWVENDTAASCLQATARIEVK